MTSLRSRSALRNYQNYLVSEIKERLFPYDEGPRKNGVLLAVDMSLGKTGAVLTAVRDLLDEFVIRKVLVVAPLRVANDVWPDEIAVWSHTRCLTYAVLTGTEAERRAALRRDVEIHIINRENLPWLWRQLGKAKWDYDLLVYDEASRLKGGRKRTKGGKKSGPRLSEFGVLAQARHHMKGVVELTGTPAPNGLIDMWGPIYILDGGERLGTSRTAFLERWFDQNPYSYKITPKEHAEKEITERVKDVMLGLRADDYLELPKTIHNLLKVRLPKEAMQEYRRFERTLVSELYDVEAVSEGVLTNKLLQFANGSMYRQVEGDKKKREVIPIHEAKLAALEGVLEEAAGQSVLLAYSFRFDLDRIRKRYPKAVVFDESPNAVKDWNAGRINLLLAHPASIGHGLNLQFGGHISVWYGLTWSLELWDQFNKRLPRPGQIHPLVYNHILIAEGTADEDVYRAMSHKGATQDAITDAIRVRLRIDQSTTS